MKCYHCHRVIKAREARSYISYRVHAFGPLHRRYWCAECGEQDSIVDAEAPKDWTERAGFWVPPKNHNSLQEQ